ncbi:MAG TPA: 16S rRNA (cytosine(1402)-N(4))-methyltransferase RsmH [Candidatus Avilachnospira avistercoris]|nr:16S rRNA (cytosine(1402)-N(4))-methyltransferase RsmH [Candidatus Avilachnospira avistercoris]
MFSHKPVLLSEVIEGLDIKPDGIYVDGTLGGGGHSEEILKRLSDRGRLIGIDRDEAAIEASSRRLSPYGAKLTILRGNYEDMQSLLLGLGIEKVDGILLDLGVSSYQFDEGERGFSYRYEAPLDMRMDRRQSLSAYEVVNGYDEQSLYRIIRDYGEDRFAKNIAKHIVMERAKKPIETTTELSEIVKQAIPMRMRESGGHPAKRTFQAIRIEVNRELEILQDSIEGLIDMLRPKGRLCIISFHSLEDRVVKNAFKKAEDPCICPKDFPVCVCGRKPKGRIITKKPIVSGSEELDANNRAHSAKLRIFEAKG